MIVSSDRWWEFEEGKGDESVELFVSNLSKSTDTYSGQDAFAIRHDPCLGLVSTKNRPQLDRTVSLKRNDDLKSPNATAPTANPRRILVPRGKKSKQQEELSVAVGEEGGSSERAKAIVALRNVFPRSEEVFSDNKKKTTLASSAYDDIEADGEIRAPTFCSSRVKKLAAADKVHSWLRSETNSSDSGPCDDGASLSSVPVPAAFRVPDEIPPGAAVGSEPSGARADVAVPPVPDTVRSVACGPKSAEGASIEKDVNLKGEPKKVPPQSATTAASPNVLCGGPTPPKSEPIRSGPYFPSPSYAMFPMPSAAVYAMPPPGHASLLPFNAMYGNQNVAPRLAAPPGFYPSALPGPNWANGDRAPCLNPNPNAASFNVFSGAGNVSGGQGRFAGNPGPPGIAMPEFRQNFGPPKDALENAKYVIMFENLPMTLIEAELRNLLKGFGSIAHVQVTKKDSSCSAYARVADLGVANWIVSTLHEAVIHGRALHVWIKK